MQYVAPDTVEDAVAALVAANGDGQILAGGTDLLVRLRAGRLAATQLVDVKNIAELTTVQVLADHISIGAAVSGAALGEHDAVRTHYPGVVEAFELIGSTQIQGRATLGGNLCNASPAADSVPALIAASARAQIAGTGGRRELPVEAVMTGPGQTALASDEMICAFHLPLRAAGTGDAYRRFIPRTEMDIAVVGAGVWLALDDNGHCSAARVSLGAVAPRPLLVSAAADALVGTRIDDSALQAAAQAASAACQPVDDKRGTVAFRTEVAGVLVRRAAAIALQRARENT